MASFKIDLRRISQDLYEQVKAEIPSRSLQAAMVLRNAELEILSGQRSGRVYRTPTGSKYTASAPGEAPAVRTNTLRGQFRPATDGLNPIIENAPAAQYAEYLEEGTDRMARRPYSERIIEKAMPQIKAIYTAPYNLNP